MGEKRTAVEAEFDGTIVEADVLYSGGWGDGPALALVFQIPDGRITEATYLHGASTIESFFARLGATSTQELIGVSLRIVLLDAEAKRPGVKEVLDYRFVVPDAFREAFKNENM
jgi:hypothetical protein